MTSGWFARLDCCSIVNTIGNGSVKDSLSLALNLRHISGKYGLRIYERRVERLLAHLPSVPWQALDEG
jgi:hypothetical protein